MLIKLKRGLRRVEKSLTRPFRRRRRKPNIYLDHMDWDGLRALIGALNQNSSAFGPLTSAVAALSVCIEGFDDQARAYEEYEALRTNLNDSLRVFSDYFNGETNPPEAAKRRIINLARGIERETEPLNRRMEQKEVGRDGGATGDLHEVLQGYRCVLTLLARFMLNENTRIWKIPGEGVPDTRLDRLPHPAAAWYNSAVPDSPRRNGCTPNTRVDVLKEVQNWTSYNNHPKLYWLNGTAGTGKTTIAYSLCEHLESSGKLVASFFCARWSPECRGANSIFPSISHQLSSFSRPFRHAISDTINEDVDVQTLPIGEQFELLIATPLRKIGYTFPVGATIVIDALDECEDGDRADQILSVLLAHASEFPVNFFFASRPEPTIVDRMQSERGGDTFLEKSLDEINPSTIRADIKTYMGAELATANPPPDNLEYLCELSGALFECAAVFVRYVMRGYLFGGTERTQRMQRLLGTPTSPVDEGDERMDPAYSAFLEAALEVDTVGGPDRAEINRVLRTVICAREPLTVGTLAGLLGMSVTRLVRYPLQALHQVLHVSNTEFVNPRHASFPNYLLDQKRSGRLHCDAGQHNVWLAQTCLDMIRVPRHSHNSHDPGTSSTRDQDWRDGDRSVNKTVPPEFMYACRHWVVHLEFVGHSKASAATERLKQELDTSTTLEMDAFYDTLLQAVLQDASQSSRSYDMMLVLHTVICAQEPLTINALAGLLTLDGDPIHSLAPVLLISATTGLVALLHDSLSTFMLDQKRSNKFYCNARQHNAWLAQRGFDMIKAPDPPFNICYLQSSYLLDREVPDLKERLGQAVSPGILYAWRYWGAHLTLANPTEDLVDALHDFLSAHLLLWMEILNLNGWVGEGAKILCRLFRWLRHPPHLHLAASILARVQTNVVLLPAKNAGCGETSAVRCVAWSSSGEYIVCAYGDAIRIWDAHTGQPVGQPLKGHAHVVNSVAYSPDGAYIVSGSYDDTIRIWDAYTGQPVGQPLRGHTGHVISVAYSPDGAYIVSGSGDNTIRIWDAHTGQPVGQPLKSHAGGISSVAYSPDGAYIVSGANDKTIRIWDAHTGQPVGQPLRGHTAIVYSVAYSPDGAYIVSGSDDDTIRIWDARTGQPVGQPLKGHTGYVISVAYSPNGAYIVSGSRDNTIRIWDAHTGQPVGRPLKGHVHVVNSVAHSPDGAYIVSGSGDKTIHIWDAQIRQSIGRQLWGHTDWVNSVAYSPDGAYMVSGSDDNTIRIGDAHTGQPVGYTIEGHTGRVKSVAYSPDGAYIASGSDDNTIRIWDARTGQPVGLPLKGHADPVKSVAYSPDGAYIVSGSSDKTIRIWDARTGQPVGQPLKGHTTMVLSATYSPDGAFIVSGSGDNTIRIWDAHTGKPVGQPLKSHTDWISSVAYSPDGAYIASGSYDNTIHIWDAHTGQPVGQPLKGHMAMVYSVAYSPDGAYIVSGSDDNTVCIWDAHTGQPVGQPLRGHTNGVNSVAYSPGGAYIVSGSRDETIRTWVTTIEGAAEPVPTNNPQLVQAATDSLSHASTSHSPTGCHPSAFATTTDPTPSQSCKSKVATLLHDWTLNEEGWVVNANQDRLIWVPHHARTTLQSPRSPLVISAEGNFTLDFHDAKLGEDWKQCFDATCVD